jgi:hypothetical protein
MQIDQTSLQIIELGDEPDDKYFCLIDLRISPNGMNIEKMRLSDPRNFDLQFRESGCLMMLTGDEINELVRRGDLIENKLHKSLFKLAKEEGLIR